VVLPIANWLAWMRLPDVFIQRLDDVPQSRQEKVFSVLYGAAAVWAFVAAGLRTGLLNSCCGLRSERPRPN
jgi:hypothetical protein